MKTIMIIALSLILSGCFGIGKKPNETIVYRTLNPELPPIACNNTSLGLPQWDFPRLMADGLQVKNTERCLTIEEDKQNDSFWRRCGEFPIDQKSNIFYGFDKDNWNQLVLNMNIIKLNNKACADTLNLVNEQRAKWIEDNKKKREKNQ